jgi:hypothetical protein
MRGPTIHKDLVYQGLANATEHATLQGLLVRLETFYRLAALGENQSQLMKHNFTTLQE